MLHRKACSITRKRVQEVKFLCAQASEGKMTGVNSAEASQPFLGSSTQWAPLHRGTHRAACSAAMCRPVPAGRSEMIGLPGDAAQRAHCSPTAKASTGMQVTLSSPHTFIGKSSNGRKAPACRLTLRWEFRNRAGRERR